MINIKKIIYNIFIKKFINKKIQFQIGDLRLNKDFDKINKISKNKVIKLSFGDKNPNKNFFVIKRSPGAGFFSNLLYVLKSLEYAEKKNFIPVVDMQNFKNKYSEKKNLNNIKNYWEVCFYKFNKYKLEEVYNSKNVFFSNNNIKITLDDYKRLKIRELYLKYIKVKKNILLSYKNDITIQCIRPATVCGVSPRMRLDLSVSMLTMQALTNGKITVFGGQQTRPNIHMKDMIRVYLHFLQLGKKEPRAKHAIGSALSVLQGGHPALKSRAV